MYFILGAGIALVGFVVGYVGVALILRCIWKER